MLTTSVPVWDEQLRSAQAIQQHLLARGSASIAHADSSAMCRQANAVGGDFYDFLRLPNGELGIAIGDVAGKGLGAALLMANLQATLRSEARRAPSELANVAANVNQQFFAACFEEGYATLFYATFDPRTRILKYLNAGHNPPLVRRLDGSIEWLETGGAPVGLFESWTFSEDEVVLNPGDVLVAYTDGIVEAQNSLGEEWGVGPLIEILHESDGETAAQTNARIWKAVDRFTGWGAQNDDMTLLVVRVF